MAGAAIKARDELIATGQAPRTYRTFVDGRQGISEENVRPDGAIIYRFNLLGQAATFAVSYCIVRSPVRSGAYRRAWFAAVDGKVWTADLNDIPPGAEVMISNAMPYARKIDTGGMRMSVPPGIIEEARQKTRARFPTLNVARTFLVLSGGDYPVPGGTEVPYILKGTSKRKDRSRGAEMTYPGLVISEAR